MGPTNQFQRPFKVFVFHLWRQQRALGQFSGCRPLTWIMLQQPRNYCPETISVIMPREWTTHCLSGEHAADPNQAEKWVQAF